jgi:hypothetical protein
MPRIVSDILAGDSFISSVLGLLHYLPAWPVVYRAWGGVKLTYHVSLHVLYVYTGAVASAATAHSTAADCCWLNRVKPCCYSARALWIRTPCIMA